MGFEIERKFTVKDLPQNVDKYPFHIIEQGYLSVIPAVRVRREDDRYYMTYKAGKEFCRENASEGAGTSAAADAEGGIGKTEYNMPLDKKSYEHLAEKADGNVIRKKRYIIPLNEDAFSGDFVDNHHGLKEKLSGMKIELDVFEAPFDGRILAEVEFPDEESAAGYRPAEWFLEDVTGDVRYSNAHMSLEEL
ncbi:MAG: adenylate cyclase [Butyrivibrio sp.]|nr:adenylate cyclase [Butyrivibrio sp.]